MNTKLLIKLILAVVFIMFFSSFVFAEVIKLKTGKIVEGKVIERTDRYIKIDFHGVGLTYFLNEIDSINRVIQNSQSTGGGSSAEEPFSYFKEGLDYASSGNFIDAEEQFKKDLKARNSTRDSQLCLDLLSLYQETKIKKEAIISTFKGLERLRIGEYEQSLSYFLEVLNEYPDFAFPNYFVGCVYAALGQFQPAINYLEKVIKINPIAPDSYNKIGMLYDAVGKSETALVYLQKAIDIHPNYAEAYANLGRTLIGVGRYEDALNNLQKALEVDFNCIDAYIGLGVFYLNFNKAEEARSYYEKSLQLKQIPSISQYAEIHGGLGHAYLVLGEKGKAKDCLLKSIEKNPNLALSYLNLASIQVSSGEYIEAKKNLEKTRELFLKAGDYQSVRRTEGYIKRLP